MGRTESSEQAQHGLYPEIHENPVQTSRTFARQDADEERRKC